jgi:type IV pilus assembly protein PilP
MKRGQFRRLLPWSLLMVLMAGCTTMGTGDLPQWVAEQRAQAKPRVKPISEPKPYVPLAYTGNPQTDLDPFSAERLTKIIDRDRGNTGCQNLMEQERNRRKEPLEAFPLDVMSMVGSLDRAGQRVALVRVDKLLYQVRTGNYLGQNYGLVTQVSENEVTLREIDQSGAECIERVATLQLQENAK